MHAGEYELDTEDETAEVEGDGGDGILGHGVFAGLDPFGDMSEGDTSKEGNDLTCGLAHGSLISDLLPHEESWPHTVRKTSSTYGLQTGNMFP